MYIVVHSMVKEIAPGGMNLVLYGANIKQLLTLSILYSSC